MAGNALGRRCGYVSDQTPVKGAEGLRADGGIIGDGCMEIYVPRDVNTGTIKWARPLAPTTGPMAVPALGYQPASTVGDLNRAGLPVLNFRKFYSMNAGDPDGKSYNGGGGMFTHPDDVAAHQRSIPANNWTDEAKEIVYSGPDGFYIQYRLKFKTLPNGDNRLDYVDPPSEAKHWVIANISDGAPMSQIVAIIRPNLDNIWGTFGAIGYWWFGDRQISPTTYQPGYNDGSCTFKDRSGCWKFRKDKWMTILVHVVPGRQNPPKPDGIGWNPEWLRDVAKHFDTGIEVWVADEDDIAAGRGYTKIHDGLNRYALYYDADYQGTHFSLPVNNGGPLKQAPGFSWFQLYPYMNPNTGASMPYEKASWVLYDQLICSTKFIPCPTV